MYLSVLGLFNGTVCISDNLASNKKVDNKLEGMWKEAVVA
jgi:hypothetical protein